MSYNKYNVSFEDNKLIQEQKVNRKRNFDKIYPETDIDVINFKYDDVKEEITMRESNFYLNFKLKKRELGKIITKIEYAFKSLNNFNTPFYNSHIKICNGVLDSNLICDNLCKIELDDKNGDIVLNFEYTRRKTYISNNKLFTVKFKIYELESIKNFYDMLALELLEYSKHEPIVPTETTEVKPQIEQKDLPTTFFDDIFG